MMTASMRNLHIVMFIGVSCVLQTTAKDCPYITKSCACQDDYVSCDNLQQVPQLQTGPNVSYVYAVVFEKGNITSIPKNSLPANLTDIAIYGHPLTNISDDAFDTSANSLNYIEIRQAKFTTLPNAFLKLTNLTELYFTDVPIQNWTDSVLQHIGTTVTKLFLRNMGLTGGINWISNFHVLQTLDLSDNSLKTIADNLFSSFQDTLTVLYLANTGLTAVPPAVTDLQNLTSLDLSGNILKETEISKLLVVRSVSKLSTLAIKSVGLTRMLNFSNVPSLQTIYLDDNNISDFNTGYFPLSVTTLTLSGNNLSSIPTFFPGMTNLYVLDVSYNQITTITNATFSNLTHLARLDLSNNPISTIPPEAFSSLTSLKRLSIGFTNLREVPAALSKLSYRPVDIRMNNIPSLSCLCPISSDLATWFLNRTDQVYISGDCNTGQTVNTYFNNVCRTAGSTTQPPTTTTASTTTHGHTPALEFRLVCIYASLLLLLSLRFCGY